MKLLRQCLALDLRSLALWRMALGLLVITDLLLRSRDLGAFYTDTGVLPRVTYLPLFPPNSFPSLHLSVGAFWGEALLFVAGLVAALALTVGYHTRLAAALTWFLLVSVQIRNPYILDVGDQELRIILFWTMFLPLGARYSIDAHQNKKWDSLPDSYSSLATFGYIVQMTLVYFMAATLKSDAMWRSTGDALYYVLSIDQFSTALGHAMLDYTAVLRPLTFAALATEYAIPLLIWLPWKRDHCRAGALGLIFLLHGGIALFMHLGMICPIAMGCALALLPGPTAARLASLGMAAGERLMGRLSLSPRLAQERPATYSLSKPAKLWLTVVILYLLALNAAAMVRKRLPEEINLVGYWSRTMQNWSLFAPYPFLDDGWFLVEGRLADGSTVDLLNDGAVISYSKPPMVSATFPNQRWRVFHQRVLHDNLPTVIQSYLKWLATTWNRTHYGGKGVASVRLIFVEEKTPPPGEQQMYVTRVLGEQTIFRNVMQEP